LEVFYTGVKSPLAHSVWKIFPLTRSSDGECCITVLADMCPCYTQ